jgi:hypothetical protein
MSYCIASVAILKTLSLSFSLVIWCTRRLQLIPICFWSWTEPAWMKLVLILPVQAEQKVLILALSEWLIVCT